MKRKFVSLLTVTMLFCGIATVSAQDVSNWKAENKPNWFTSVKSDKNMKINQDTNQYYFIHNNGNKMDPSILESLADQGSIKVSKEAVDDATNLIGISTYKNKEKIFTDFYFSNRESEDVNVIEEKAIENAKKHFVIKDKGAVSTLATTDSTSYYDSFTWYFYDFRGTSTTTDDILAGTYTSNVTTIREGSVAQNGKSISVWDVKSFNQTQPVNSYQTRQIITRTSVESFSNETLISYGPPQTSTSSKFTVSLTGLVPTFAWIGNTSSSTISDSSSVSGKYGRWTVDFALGSTTAKNSFYYEPGVRFTNSSGNFGIEHSHNLNYYKDLNSASTGGTGVITRYYSDVFPILT